MNEYNIPLNIIQSILLIHQTEDELSKIKNIFKFKEKKKLKENIKLVDESLRSFNNMIIDRRLLYNLDHVLINNHHIFSNPNMNYNDIILPYAENYNPSLFVPITITKNSVVKYEYNIINDNIIINIESSRLKNKKILYDQEDNKGKSYYSEILLEPITDLFYNFLHKKSIKYIL